MSSSTQFQPLQFTSTNLANIINFIKDQNVVALHTTTACRVFHAISFENPDDVESLTNVRVIYLDCNSHPDLLAEGEWEYFIHHSIQGVHELGKESLLRKAIIQQSDAVPHRVYTSLGE